MCYVTLKNLSLYTCHVCYHTNNADNAVLGYVNIFGCFLQFIAMLILTWLLSFNCCSVRLDLRRVHSI
jgi:hypothetical protein